MSCFNGGDGGISARFARRIASAKPKILRFRLGFLGRQVLTRCVLIHTIKQKRHPQKGCLFVWRRWWDSNPRARLRTKRFRVVLVTTTSIHLRINVVKI